MENGIETGVIKDYLGSFQNWGGPRYRPKNAVLLVTGTSNKVLLIFGESPAIYIYTDIYV